VGRSQGHIALVKHDNLKAAFGKTIGGCRSNVAATDYDDI
jgi:hypothetical protein